MKIVSAWIVSLALLGSSAAWSQAAPVSRVATGDTMPPWTVLVLKLVSATHVEPTTGIVLAEPDLVLVPLEFARTGDEILVLDGGTDIVRHGRPAFLVHSLPGDQLAILRVQGLNRPAATLSSISESEIKALSLVAFPPAEQIAQGSAPVRSQVKALPAITTAHPTLDPYPNVTGALSDDCGNLVAFNLAVDVQSMQPASGARLAWRDGLKRAAELAGKPFREQSCQASAQTSAAPEPEVQDPPPEEPDSMQPDPEPQPEEPQPGLVEEETPADAQTEAEEIDEQDSTGDQAVDAGAPVVEPAADTEAVAEMAPMPDQGFVQGPNEAPGAETIAADLPSNLSRTTLFLAGLALFMILGWSIHYLRKKSVAANPVASNTPGKGSQEPRTIRFETKPGPSHAVFLLAEIQWPDGTKSSEKLPVSGQDWKANIGRQDAQLILDSPSVSRLHARIEVHEGRLTISDLDSTNGTRVNGIACLPGEVFFIQAGDKVVLGDASLSLQLVAGDD